MIIFKKTLVSCSAFLLLVLGSCDDTPAPVSASQQVKQAFDMNAFLAQEAQALNQANAQVSKTVTQAAQQTETKTVTGLDWSQELAPFSDADINKPALIGLFKEERGDNAAGQTVHRFIAKEGADTNVQEVVYVINTQNQLVQVSATIVQENMLFSTHKKLHLQANPEKSPHLLRYRLHETQKLLFMSADAYGVEGTLRP